MTATQLEHVGLKSPTITTAATTFHGWAHLPAELKLEILSHYLPVSQTISQFAHNESFNNQFEALLGTCNKEFIALSLDTYYSRNTFVVDICDLVNWNGYTLVKGPPTAQGRRIRDLVIRIYDCGFGPTPESMFTRKFSGWRFLLQPREFRDGSWIEICNAEGLAWQAYFPNLRSMKIHLELQDMESVWKRPSDMCRDCLFHKGRLEVLVDWVKKMDVDLKADEVKVFIAHKNSKNWGPCRCRCTVPIEKLMTRMATRAK